MKNNIENTVFVTSRRNDMSDIATMNEASNKIRTYFNKLRKSNASPFSITCEDGYSLEYSNTFLWLVNDDNGFRRPFLEAPVTLRIQFVHFLEHFMEEYEQSSEDEIAYKKAVAILEKRHK